MYEAAPVARKRLLMIPGADHNDEDLLEGDRMIQETVAFLEEAFPGRVSHKLR